MAKQHSVGQIWLMLGVSFALALFLGIVLKQSNISEVHSLGSFFMVIAAIVFIFAFIFFIYRIFIWAFRRQPDGQLDEDTADLRVHLDELEDNLTKEQLKDRISKLEHQEPEAKGDTPTAGQLDEGTADLRVHLDELEGNLTKEQLKDRISKLEHQEPEAKGDTPKEKG